MLGSFSSVSPLEVGLKSKELHKKFGRPASEESDLEIEMIRIR